DQYSWSGHSIIINAPEETWQNIQYVYGIFSDEEKQAREKYREFVEKGISIGKRPELTGGGLLRSSGGWAALKGFRKVGIRVKGDERILGDSDFVETALKTAKEAFEEKYDLKMKGFDFELVIKRVAEEMGIHLDVVTAFGKSPQTVQARSLLCFWAHRKLGMSTIEIAKRLKMSQPAVSRSSKRGEAIEKENRYELLGQKRDSRGGAGNR
ncbi:MAG: transposase, partial [Proteobacteria bacterium]|nr:transposase [Pseudomonadota bacterium]